MTEARCAAAQYTKFIRYLCAWRLCILKVRRCRSVDRGNPTQNRYTDMVSTNMLSWGWHPRIVCKAQDLWRDGPQRARIYGTRSAVRFYFTRIVYSVWRTSTTSQRSSEPCCAEVFKKLIVDVAFAFCAFRSSEMLMKRRHWGCWRKLMSLPAWMNWMIPVSCSTSTLRCSIFRVQRQPRGRLQSFQTGNLCIRSYRSFAF